MSTYPLLQNSGGFAQQLSPSIPMPTPLEGKGMIDPDLMTPESRYRSSTSKKLTLLLPILFHVVIVAGAAVFMFMIDGHQAFLTRSITITRADGSVYTQTVTSPIQSDFTIIISFFSTLARTIGAWGASGILWRSAFLFMEQGRISLGGLKRLLGRLPLYPNDVSKKRHFLLFSALLFVSLCLDNAAPILNASITWNPSLYYVTSDEPIQNLPGNGPGLSLAQYRTSQTYVGQLVSTAVAMGDVTWGTTGTNSTLMTRVLQEIDALPKESLIQNITIPYFVVDDFEWIQDPTSTLTTQQKTILFNYTGYSPYAASSGWLGLIPDQQWGPLSNANTTDPLTVSETRLLALRMSALPGYSGCNAHSSTIPSDVGTYSYSANGSNDCYVFAQVTYRAGAAACDSCPSTAPAIVQQDPSRLTLAPDSLTAESLAIAPYVGSSLMITQWALPSNPPFARIQDQAVEFLSRSYQSSWSSLTDALGDPSLNTGVQIAVPTTQASIMRWKVFLWVGLHIIVMLASGFSYTLQQSASYPWVEDPTFAVLLLDSDELRRSQAWGGNDPWRPDSNLPNVMLSLVDGGSRRRRIVVHNPVEKA